MAKETKNKSKKSETSEIVPIGDLKIPEVMPSMKMDINMTNEDIVSIAVSDREEQLTTIMERLKKAKTQTEKDIDDVTNTAKKLIDELVASNSTLELKQTIAKLLKLSGVEFNGDLGKVIEMSPDYNIIDEIDESRIENEISYHLGISVSSQSTNRSAVRFDLNYMIKGLRIKATPKIKENLVKLVELRKQLSNIHKDIMDIRGHMQSIDVFSRKVRAELARGILNTSENGKQLNKLMSSVHAKPIVLLSETT